MTKSTPTRTKRSFRSAILELLCEHGGRCDGPARTGGRVTANRAVVPCMGLIVQLDGADGSTKGAKKAAKEENERLEAAGWTVLRLREKPHATVGPWDVVIEKGAPQSAAVLAVGRQVPRMHNAGTVACSPATLVRLHDAIRPAPKKHLASYRPLAPRTPPTWMGGLGDKGVVLVDCDGTLYDPMACHGIRGNFRSSGGCTHVRHDTVAIVRDICERENAVPVILSWRSGMYQLTKDWCAEIELGEVAVLVPGSPVLPSTKPRHSLWGQVGFKVEVADALIEAGVRVVASFDDNAEVCEAMRGIGVPYAHQVPHLVEVSSYEWSTGRKGAKRPGRTSGSQLSFPDFGRSRQSSGPAMGRGWSWDDDGAFYDGDGDWDGSTDRRPVIEDETDLRELIDSGDAEYGRDYTIDGTGNVVPLYDTDPTLSAMHIEDGSPHPALLADEAEDFLRAHAGGAGR